MSNNDLKTTSEEEETTSEEEETTSEEEKEEPLKEELRHEGRNPSMMMRQN